MDIQLARLVEVMADYDRGDPMRIHHFLKVHSLAAVIGRREGLDEETLFVLETAAIVHDIGIHLAEQRHGSSAGTWQEKEGPAEARRLLTEVGGYTEAQIRRVEYLVAHHHTYTHIEGADYQILVEADFLVNIFEDHLSTNAVERIRRKIFRTATGLRLLDAMYGSTWNPRGADAAGREV